jgi:hypothetical protein
MRRKYKQHDLCKLYSIIFTLSGKNCKSRTKNENNNRNVSNEEEKENKKKYVQASLRKGIFYFEYDGKFNVKL